MTLLIEKVVNKPVDSNCFVLYKQNNESCIVIDPGTRDCYELLILLRKLNLRPEFIMLTHEHFDHIWGVNTLKDIFNCKILSSKKCCERLVNRKKNMSIFYDQIGFEVYPCDLEVFSDDIFIWESLDFTIIEAPGHTDSSLCILVENNLFTGDTIIKNAKTVTKFPSGNRNELIKTLRKISNFVNDKKLRLYPGHGHEFYLDKIHIEEFI